MLCGNAIQIQAQINQLKHNIGAGLTKNLGKSPNHLSNCLENVNGPNLHCSRKREKYGLVHRTYTLVKIMLSIILTPHAHTINM